MDGRFVPNITIGPLVVKAVRAATKLPLDVHLMIVEPERYIDEFAHAGADLISVHAESSPHLHRTIQQLRALGKRASVALNPHTSLDDLHVVLPDLSMVLLMTVNRAAQQPRAASPDNDLSGGDIARKNLIMFVEQEERRR